MVPVTFKQIRDIAYRDIVLSELYHAEKVLLIRNLGREEDELGRDTAMAVAKLAASYIVVSISEDTEELEAFDDSQTLDRAESIIVQCFRDPKTVNSDAELLGGLADPNLRDGILRSVPKDPSQRPYYFIREIQHPTDVLWRLKFSRYIAGIRGIGA